MAFTPAFEARRAAPARVAHSTHELSIISDSQSSWVVFNPPHRVATDILSFSTNDVLTQTESHSLQVEDEDEEDEDDEDDDFDEQKEAGNAHVTRREDSDESGSEIDDDELIDHLHMTLSNRIEEWQKTTDTAVSDNIASWDLDEELVSHILDKSVLRPAPRFYGDHYFENMSKADYARFQRTSAKLRRSLTQKGAHNVNSDILLRLLELLQWQTLLRTSGSLVDDYIVNTLARTSFHASVLRNLRFANTATLSSLVSCGGGSSWNEI